MRSLRRMACAALFLGIGVSDVVFGSRGSWTSGGPVGGSVAAFVVAPTSPNVVYAMTNDALIFRSTDKGTNWRVASVGLPVGLTLFQGIESLAVDAGSAFTVYACPGDRLFKSTNGGDWVPLAVPPAPAIYDIATDPKTPGTIYIATALEGLYKSIDGGASWLPKNSGLRAGISGVTGLSVETITISPSDPSTIYVSLTSGVFVSRDAGEHWAPGNFLFSDARIAVEPTDPATAIAIGPAFTGAYLTRDFGASWVPLVVPVGWYLTSVLFDPYNPSAIFAAGYAPAEAPVLARSDDFGSSWERIAAGPPGEIIDCLAIPSSSTLLAGFLKSGVFRSGNLGRTWTSSNDGLIAVFMNSLAVSPSDPSRLYSGSWDGHLYRSDDGGSRWTLTGLESFGVYGVAVDPQDSQTVYVSIGVVKNFESPKGGAIVRSNDGGASWVELLSDIEPFNVVVVDPVVPSTIYVGANGIHNDGLMKSVDGGNSWSKVDASFGASTLSVRPCFSFEALRGWNEWNLSE